MRCFVICCTLVLSLPAVGQVEEIKEKSAENRRNRKQPVEQQYQNNDHQGGFFLFDLFFGIIPSWQQLKLSADRTRYPSLVSVEILTQGALNPPNYYFIWPRIRGNWGIFSSDFRMNYLIDRVSDGSYAHIRTNDWQVLQLNIITSRFITLRTGAGMMNEAFTGGGSFMEWTAMLEFHNRLQSDRMSFEYRHARDWVTNAWPRFEISAQYQRQILTVGKMHTLLSVGLVYQNYYRTIPVTGLMSGLLFRFY
jgi:hypothetical protein